ncbi:hypothetical protein G6O69_13540 [Pseudenhygromyxa sp. WMMC2535]|uniref:hypothetical protein n=1 Tax=Pseudenhygromyxa sp. WMMC2535 TaxID=2712867 RepID=UPI001557B74F|nr:hypothetical protein [Pseudenhygromyxa sp. WMMC2535]NVB38859.1 hypothetical protein [Pseudenhygromyxa sp. WMMC2535]
MSPLRRRADRLLAWSAAGSLVFAASSLAHASPAGEVVRKDESIAADLVLIRVVPERPEIDSRVQAELGLLGFVSEPLALEGEGLGPDLLDHLAGLEREVSAGIEIDISDTRVDLWIADAETGKTVHRRLDPREGDCEPRTIAIAAVELLRASRLEAAHHDEGPEEPPPTVQVVEDELPPDEKAPKSSLPLQGALSLAPALLSSPGGVGVSSHIEVGGRWAPATIPRFALRVSAWVPTLGNRVEDPRGSARIFIGMIFIEPQLRLPGGAPWFHPELGLGLGAMVISAIGEATDGAGSRDSQTVLPAFVSHVHGGLGFSATPRLWIRLDGFLGIAQPQPVIFFADQESRDEIVRWGLPWGGGSLGLEVWL